MTNTSYAPDEDALTILSEDMWIQGILITAIVYGAVITLGLFCVSMLVRGFQRARKWLDGSLILLVTLTLSLNTVVLGTSIQLIRLGFIDDRDYPGGPSAYEEGGYSVPLLQGQNTSILASILLGDALLVSCILTVCHAHG